MPFYFMLHSFAPAALPSSHPLSASASKVLRTQVKYHLLRDVLPSLTGKLLMPLVLMPDPVVLITEY